ARGPARTVSVGVARAGSPAQLPLWQGRGAFGEPDRDARGKSARPPAGRPSPPLGAYDRRVPVLTLLTDPARTRLPRTAAEGLPAAWDPGEPRWLAPGVAVQVPLAGRVGDDELF